MGLGAQSQDPPDVLWQSSVALNLGQSAADTPKALHSLAPPAFACAISSSVRGFFSVSLLFLDTSAMFAFVVMCAWIGVDVIVVAGRLLCPLLLLSCATFPPCVFYPCTFSRFVFSPFVFSSCEGVLLLSCFFDEFFTTQGSHFSVCLLRHLLLLSCA